MHCFKSTKRYLNSILKQTVLIVVDSYPLQTFLKKVSFQYIKYVLNLFLKRLLFYSIIKV